MTSGAARRSSSVVRQGVNNGYQKPYMSQGFRCTPTLDGSMNASTARFTCKLQGADVPTAVTLTFTRALPAAHRRLIATASRLDRSRRRSRRREHRQGAQVSSATASRRPTIVASSSLRLRAPMPIVPALN